MCASLTVVLPLLFLIALGPAALLAYTLAPSPTVLNQLMAIAGWGVALVGASKISKNATLGLSRAIVAAVACYGAMGAYALVSGMAPISMVWPALATVAAAVAVALLGKAYAHDHEQTSLNAFTIAWLWIGGVNVFIAVIQVFLPELADGTWIARSQLPARAVGNLRQPNHLSTALLWSAVAVVPLLERGRLGQFTGAGLFVLFIFATELTASRTGMVGVLVLAVWGALDRKLSRRTRVLLLASPVIYGLGWGVTTLWTQASQQSLGIAARLSEGDVSGSRFGIWANTLALIREAPLTGVGFGDFNFAWTLTPFPGRPTAFFDHTHNIVLQLLVENGLVVGGVVVVLLGVALWQAFSRAVAVDDERAVGFRSAFVLVLLMALHSQLEYPLWYAHFLLPTAWAWGYCLGAPQRTAVVSKSDRATGALAIAGVLMVIGAAWAAHDYLNVARIFEPAADAEPLDRRIAKGRASLFFGHHADYAAATVAERPSEAWDSFKTSTHYLLDSRLMLAWAKGFAERGELDKARHLAQRLREFHKAETEEFFAPCEAGDMSQFQCVKPTRVVDWREFRGTPHPSPLPARGERDRAPAAR